TFRERMQVNGRPLAEEAITAAAHRLWPAIRREEPSFFEATTAIAFLAFAEAGVDAAVIEVGLGGRLDATNVIEPEVVSLTNVALDHVEYLGNTLVSVAREKAGIIKAGTPTVTAETDPAVLEVFRERAAEVSAPLIVIGAATPAAVRTTRTGTCFRLSTERWGELHGAIPLLGPHQARNAALAVRTLEALGAPLRPDREAVVQGLARVRWPGRLQWERLGGRDWIFDVAHNPAAIRTMVAALRGLPVPRPLVAVVGILADKDSRGMLDALAGIADELVLTLPPTAPEHRRWDPEAVARERADPHVRAVPDFEEALDAAAAAAGDGTVLVTGSFHTVGDALCALGRAPW
ncbi:MAG TPA: Mur ligase family protein, partial [Longimicrobiales bacterium]